MFDAGMLTLDPQGLIVSADHGDANEYNDSDRALSAELHGKRALLPDSKGLRPAPESLLANYEQYGWSAAPWSLKI
jgi:hypothetical protein